jgi:hypothetical protein
MDFNLFKHKKVETSSLLFAVKAEDIPKYLKLHNIVPGQLGIWRRVDEDIYSFSGVKEKR